MVKLFALIYTGVLLSSNGMVVTPVLNDTQLQTVESNLDRKKYENREHIEIIYEVDMKNTTAETMDSIVVVVKHRLELMGYNEVVVNIVDGNKIQVNIYDFENINEITDDMITQIINSPVLSFENLDGEVYLTGEDITEATVDVYVSEGSNIQHIVVALHFTEEGSEKFYVATSETVGEQLLITLDDSVISMPVVSEPIRSESAQISGNFSREEAKVVADIINASRVTYKLNFVSKAIVQN